ncbi:MAG: hypothetical protein J4400_00335 [Candidatus Aenigmarchaeota archaeon]|nr:hypothetical protein [Candidatus Aenigmarchaeota archaeon]
MRERNIIRQLREMLSVSDRDIPKTLLRFKRETEEMKKELEASPSN